MSYADPVRALLDASFDDFGDDDWAHCQGGLQVLLHDAVGLVGHAAVVPRTLWCAGTAMYVGYVEGVAVRPDARGCGHGAVLMGAVESAPYDVLALSATVPDFYARRGWQLWRGPTAVRTPAGVARTPEDDGGVMVRGGRLDLDAELVCDWRSGDVW